MRKVRKLLRLLPHASYRAALGSGVVAAIEHDSVAFYHDFSTIVDVGANRGQFALVAARRFPHAKLYCFEPLESSRVKLARVLSDKRDMELHAVALGASSRIDSLHVSRREDSSSLLAIGTAQTTAFPGTDEASSIAVVVARLDEILSAERIARPCLMKLDVQGYELEVLRGSEGLLDSIDELLVECSFVELYEQQALVDDVVAYCRERDFHLAGVFSLAHDSSGRCLQGDFLFVRSA